MQWQKPACGCAIVWHLVPDQQRGQPPTKTVCGVSMVQAREPIIENGQYAMVLVNPQMSHVWITAIEAPANQWQCRVCVDAARKAARRSEGVGV